MAKDSKEIVGVELCLALMAEHKNRPLSKYIEWPEGKLLVGPFAGKNLLEVANILVQRAADAKG